MLSDLTTPLRVRPLAGHATYIGKAPPAREVFYAADELCSMKDARTKIFDSGDTSGSPRAWWALMLYSRSLFYVLMMMVTNATLLTC